IEGKRGQVTLNFSFTDNGKVVGKGVKRMVASGLRPYEKEAVDDLVERFNARKDAFIEAQAVAA
ncbi:DUF3581 family protein, partial [Vibrio nigripulchritudo]|uniref:DUF3581 family protein n=1 Tax=Vibrio nigripulchritudo TaxID=28173 RepID=UPI0005701664